MSYLAFAGVGAFAFGILLLPLLVRRIRLHSVYGWMLVSAFVGLLVRPTFLLIFSPDRAEQESFFWLDVSLEEFIWPVTVLWLGCLLFAGSYAVGNSTRAEFRRLNRLQGDTNALALAGSIVALVGILAAVSFVQSTGGFSLGSLSTKRVVASESAIADGLEAFGPTLAVGRAGLVGALVSFHLRRTAQRPVRFATLLVLANAFLPFYASDRTGVILVVLQLLALSALRVQRMKRKTLITTAVVVLLLFQVLTTLRATGRSDDSFQLVSPIDTVESILVNRSLFDLSKNLHVVRETGGVLEVKFGESYVGALAAPIPRSIWSEKPLISVGPEVGQRIYGNAIAGIPPGVFAEAYWNFLLPGLLGVSILFGSLCGKLDSVDRDRLKPFGQVVYVVVLLPLAYNAVASSFSGVVLDFLGDSIALLAIWVLHLALERKRTPDRIREPMMALETPR